MTTPVARCLPAASPPPASATDTVMNRFSIQLIKLTIFFFLIGFLAGRIGMLLHEFCGHVLAWRLLGGGIDGFRLFVFGGGWVRYGGRLPAVHASTLPMLFVQLSGIAVELAGGMALAVFAAVRVRDGIVRTLCSATSAVLIVHAPFYLVTCSYYGSGDGAGLFDMLQGDTRTVFVAVAFVLTVLGAFIVARVFSPVARYWAGGRTSRQGIALVVLSVLGAAMLHGLATAAEQLVVQDGVYADIKTPVSERLKQEELVRRLAGYTRRAGGAPDGACIDGLKKELDEKYWRFPIEIPLGVAVAAAFLAGFMMSQSVERTKAGLIGWNELGRLVALSASAVVLIVLLNRL